MLTSPEPVKLLRYLVMWRINASLVRLHTDISIDLSRTLGMLIAERLPTRQAAPWRKSLAKGDAPPLPDALWPILSTLFVHPIPGRVRGQGELFVWELKLFGNSADHDLFLEIILPAMEEAGYTTDDRWYAPYSLWGHFDIQSIFVAKGQRWEPLATEGRLDLRYRPAPEQWAENFAVEPVPNRTVRHLTWVTPVDLGNEPETPLSPPALSDIVQGLGQRLHAILPGKRTDPETAWDALGENARDHWRQAVQLAGEIPLVRCHLKTTPASRPGRWIGTQVFQAIPPGLLPYLQLSSILHVGRHAHFGCGTFVLA